MKATRLLILTFFMLVFAISCRKMSFEPNWDVELLLPFAQSDLTIDQLLSKNELRVNADGDYEIFYEDEIFSYKLDSLFQIPDTTILKINQGSPIPINIAPGQTWLSDTNNNRFQIRDVSLLEAELAEGMIIFELISNITEPVDMVYEIPGAIKDGNSLRISRRVPAASSQSAPVTIQDSIDLTGYTLDLRGKDKNTANTVYFFFTATLASNANQVTIGGLQYINVKTTYKNLLPYFGRGYFRNQVLNERGTADDFNVFGNFPSGTIDIDAMELNFRVKNSIGVDIQARISELEAVNSNTNRTKKLTGPGIDQILNLDRATMQSDNNPPVFVQVKEQSITTDNSNIDELLEVLPDQVNYALDLEINPLGNISGGNDFIYLNTGIEIDLDARIPLRFAAEDLVFRDTLDFVLDSADRELGTASIASGTIYLKSQNTFPFSVRPMLYFMTADGQIADSVLTSEYIRPHYESSQFEYTENLLPFPVSEAIIDRLYDFPFIVIKLELETAEKKSVRLRPGQYLHSTLSADFKYNVKTSLF